MTKWGNAGRQVEHLGVFGTRFMGGISTLIRRERSYISWRKYMHAPATGQGKPYQPLNRTQNISFKFPSTTVLGNLAYPH
jgi:hypothetical protein